MKANDGKIYSCKRLGLSNLSIVEEYITVHREMMYWVTDPSHYLDSPEKLLRESVKPKELELRQRQN